MRLFRTLHYRPAIDHRLLDNAIDIHSLLWNCILRPKEMKLLYALRSSHAEIWLPDIDTCYTSTMDGVNNGSVCRPASEIIKHPERWYYYEYQVCDEAFIYMKTWMDLEVANNEGYDKGDILKFFLPYRKQKVEDRKKICSGFTWIALFKAAVRHNLYKYDKVLFNIITNGEIDDLYSPLLLSYKQFKAGAMPIDLKTGKPLLEK